MKNFKKRDFKNIFFSSYTRGKKRGVAIVIANSLNFELISEIKDKEGRYILVKGRLEHKEVTLFNVYAPPHENNITFMKKMFELIATETYGTLICAGDFNMILNPGLDTTNMNRKKNPTEKKVSKIIQDLGLIDVWRDMNRYELEYTFYSNRHCAHSRIDYFFMYNRDIHKVKSCRIGQRDVSDHSGVYLKIQLQNKRKNTLWRLNTGILNNQEFIAGITSELDLYIQENDTDEVNPAILWDAAKAVLRGSIIAKTSLLKKLKNKKLFDLQ